MSTKLGLLTISVLVASCAGTTHADGEDAAQNAVTTASGLKYIEIAAGEGAVATKGDVVAVQYTGWIQKADGTPGMMFDTSRDIGRPIEFRLGQRKVIEGWEEGISGMRVGGQRRLVIPSTLAYGTHGLGKIVLPNQNLIFEIELVGLKSK